MIIVKNFFCHCRNIRPVERYRRSSASSLCMHFTVCPWCFYVCISPCALVFFMYAFHHVPLVFFMSAFHRVPLVFYVWGSACALGVLFDTLLLKKGFLVKFQFFSRISFIFKQNFMKHLLFYLCKTLLQEKRT